MAIDLYGIYDVEGNGIHYFTHQRDKDECEYFVEWVNANRTITSDDFDDPEVPPYTLMNMVPDIGVHFYEQGDKLTECMDCYHNHPIGGECIDDKEVA